MSDIPVLQTNEKESESLFSILSMYSERQGIGSNFYLDKVLVEDEGIKYAKVVTRHKTGDIPYYCPLSNLPQLMLNLLSTGAGTAASNAGTSPSNEAIALAKEELNITLARAKENGSVMTGDQRSNGKLVSIVVRDNLNGRAYGRTMKKNDNTPEFTLVNSVHKPQKALYATDKGSYFASIMQSLQAALVKPNNAELAVLFLGEGGITESLLPPMVKGGDPIPVRAINSQAKFNDVAWEKAVANWEATSKAQQQEQEGSRDKRKSSIPDLVDFE